MKLLQMTNWTIRTKNHNFNGMNFMKRIFTFLAAFLASSFFFSFSLTYEEIQKLRVSPQKEYFFTGEECEFVLELSGYPVANVSLPNVTSSFSSIQNASFSSMIKEEYLNDEGKKSTRLHLIYVFSKPLTSKVPPLEVYLRGYRYRIPFAKFDIYENPSIIHSEIFTDIKSDKITLGEKIVFTVYERFALQVLNFSYQIPQNSIFEELERYDVLTNQKADHNFSPENVPMAKFSWTPLTQGEYELPEFRVITTNYNGTRGEPKLPKQTIKVVKIQEKSSGKENAASINLNLVPEENENAEETVKDTIAVYAVPESSSRIVANIEKSTKYKIIDETSKYYLIKTGKITGWIAK